MMQRNSKMALVALILASFTTTANAFDFASFFGFGDKKEEAPQEQPKAESPAQKDAIKDMAVQFAQEQGLDIKGLTALTSNPIVNSLTSDLGVTEMQAAGGTAALLTLAAEKIGWPQNTELLEKVPQLTALTSLLPEGVAGKLNSLSEVQNVFSSLGLDPSMIAKFTPIIISALGSLGASGDLTEQLSSIWK